MRKFKSCASSSLPASVGLLLDHLKAGQAVRWVELTITKCWLHFWSREARECALKKVFYQAATSDCYVVNLTSIAILRHYRTSIFFHNCCLPLYIFNFESQCSSVEYLLFLIDSSSVLSYARICVLPLQKHLQPSRFQSCRNRVQSHGLLMISK